MKNQLSRCRLTVEHLETRLAPASYNSTNWAGYAVQASNGAVTAVTATWTVPMVSGSGTAYSATWVGIDGNVSSTVEQIGTASDVVNGEAHYYAWYEMYPSVAITIPDFPVAAGDVMTATVKFVSAKNGISTFSLSIVDTPATAGPFLSFTTTQAIRGAARSSAEWIQEAPSDENGLLPLAAFSPVIFSSATARINGKTKPIDFHWSGTTLYRNNMVNPETGASEATAGAIIDSGSPLTSSFTITYNSTTSGKLPLQKPAKHHHGMQFLPNQAAEQPGTARSQEAVVAATIWSSNAQQFSAKGLPADPMQVSADSQFSVTIHTIFSAFDAQVIGAAGGTGGYHSNDTETTPQVPSADAKTDDFDDLMPIMDNLDISSVSQQGSPLVLSARDASFLDGRWESLILESVARGLSFQSDKDTANVDALGGVVWSLATFAYLVRQPESRKRPTGEFALTW